MQHGWKSQGGFLVLNTLFEIWLIIYFQQIWEVYKDRRCVRTYFGHRQAVRDICFNNAGDKFLSAAYDRYIKLWDTETGQVISRFTNKKVPYCVKFNPEEDKQHLFVAGMADKKIVCVSYLIYLYFLPTYYY